MKKSIAIITGIFALVLMVGLTLFAAKSVKKIDNIYDTINL